MMQKVKIGRYFMYADDEAKLGLKIVQNGTNYEIHIRKELERLIPNAKTFLDVGANIGVHSVSAKDINPDVKVFSVEAARQNVDTLYRTIADNGFKDFTVIPIAAGSRCKLIGINSDPENPACDQSLGNGCDNYTQAIPISFYRLPKIDVVKIDIEGFEYEAWLGMEEIIDAGVSMFFEFIPSIVHRSMVEPEQQLNWILGKGYTITVLDFIPGIKKEFTVASDVLDYINKTTGWIADILAERK